MAVLPGMPRYQELLDFVLDIEHGKPILIFDTEVSLELIFLAQKTLGS